MRRAAKNDSVQAELVKHLRSMGISVVILGKPVDLLVHHWRWPQNQWMLMEVKTPNRKVKKGIRLRKDQLTQQKFCAWHNIPYVSTLVEALRAMNAWKS